MNYFRLNQKRGNFNQYRQGVLISNYVEDMYGMDLKSKYRREDEVEKSYPISEFTDKYKWPELSQRDIKITGNELTMTCNSNFDLNIDFNKKNCSDFLTLAKDNEYVLDNKNAFLPNEIKSEFQLKALNDRLPKTTNLEQIISPSGSLPEITNPKQMKGVYGNVSGDNNQGQMREVNEKLAGIPNPELVRVLNDKLYEFDNPELANAQKGDESGKTNSEHDICDEIQRRLKGYHINDTTGVLYTKKKGLNSKLMFGHGLKQEDFGKNEFSSIYK